MGARGVVAGLAVASWISACTPPSHIAEGVCGNSVLEPGEDCDTNADPTLGANTMCAACRYSCAAAGASCPDGWSCARDGVCRHAIGAFVPGAIIPEPAISVELADYDGDGRTDLVGAGARVFWGRLGSPDLRFTQGFALPANASAGAPAYHDLDGDGRMDLIFGFTRAFLVLAGSDATFDFVSQPTIEIHSSAGIDLVPVHTDPASPFNDYVGWAASDTFFALQLVPRDLSALATLILPDYHTVAELRGHAVADVDPGQPGGDELALTFDGETRVRLFTTGQDATGKRTLAAAGEVAIPEPVPTGTGIAFADWDGDGAPDLLTPMTGGLAVARGDDLGGFAPATLDASFAGLGWPLAIGDLDGDGAADYVLASGIYLRRPGGLVKPSTPTALGDFATATVGDFNRDGIADVAVSIAGQNALTVLLGSASGLFSGAAFQTDGPVLALRAGDYDGDRVTDFAIAESSSGGDRLSVFFGATFGPFAGPVPMARLEHMVGMDPAIVEVPNVAEDVTSDLIVRSSPTGAPDDVVGVYVTLGNAAREMVSAFDLAGDVKRLFLGHFSPGGDPDLDVLAVTSNSMTGPRLALVHGHGGAHFHPDDRRLFADDPSTLGMFDPDCASFAAGDVDGDGHDELVALTTSTCGTPALMIGTIGGDDTTPALAATMQPWTTAYTAATSLDLTDVDGDGAPDLVAVYAEGLVVYWNDAGSFDPARAAVAPADPAGGAWIGAAMLNADGDAARELALGAADGIYLAEVAGRAIQLAPSPAVAPGGHPWTGDLDGDGLDDLVVSGDQVSVFLAVPHDQAGVP